MTESPDFVRNQDFFRIFVSNILLAIFSDPNADPNGRGLESTGQGQTGFFLSGPVFFVLTKATPGYAGGEKELIARGGVDKKKSPS